MTPKERLAERDGLALRIARLFATGYWNDATALVGDFVKADAVIADLVRPTSDVTQSRQSVR